MDNLSKEKRSKVMSSIRGKNTRPEMTVRKMLWKNGLRYRIHNRSIFGTPDISIKKEKLAVFIDGCFWHGCKKCYKEPRSNIKYWRAKIDNNKKRRLKVRTQLSKDGWKVLEFWEHEIDTDPNQVSEKIILALNCTAKR